MTAPFWGKYRAKVVNNVDPEQSGRIIPLAPAVSELPLTWALPCAPSAGPGEGLFMVPEIGANVWIEFENGDPNYPIWTGGFWADGECPAQPALPTTTVAATSQCRLAMDDLQSSSSWTVTTPAGEFSVAISPEGIQLTVGESSIAVAPDGIQLESSGSVLKVGPEGVNMTSGESEVDVAPAAVKASSTTASVEVAAAGLSLSNGASSVELTSASVSINKGALEVI